MITKKEKKERIRKKIKEYLEYRKSTQEWIHPNAGCIFKNPDKKSAGLLIDACGLKGKSRGGAYISSKHANFMINKGKARASDVLRLIDLVKKKVKKEFNIILEPEIKVWG